jgi:hypothetical protein
MHARPLPSTSASLSRDTAASAPTVSAPNAMHAARAAAPASAGIAATGTCAMNAHACTLGSTTIAPPGADCAPACGGLCDVPPCEGPLLACSLERPCKPQLCGAGGAATSSRASRRVCATPVATASPRVAAAFRMPSARWQPRASAAGTPPVAATASTVQACVPAEAVWRTTAHPGGSAHACMHAAHASAPHGAAHASVALT